MNIADAIMLDRKRNKMTQTEFAAKVGSNRATVSFWENGTRFPNVVQLGTIALLFGWDDKLLAEVIRAVAV